MLTSPLPVPSGRLCCWARGRFTLALASSLNLDGSTDRGTFDQSGAPSLLDQYEYAMHGKIYKWKQDSPKAAVEVYVSFGGAPPPTHRAVARARAAAASLSRAQPCAAALARAADATHGNWRERPTRAAPRRAWADLAQAC